MAADGQVASWESASLLQFDLFQLDTRSGQLWRNGIPVDLPPQALRILVLLAGRPNLLITRKEIKQALWPNETYGDFDSRLNYAIRKLREALKDSAEQPRYIRTMRNAGYIFIAPLREVPPEHSDTLPFAFRAKGDMEGALHLRIIEAWKSVFSKMWVRPGVAVASLVITAAVAVVAFRWQSKDQVGGSSPLSSSVLRLVSHDPGDVIEISSVTSILPTGKQRIVIKGRGFGLHVPYARTDSPYLVLRNTSAHWAAGRVIPWNWDEVMLDVEAWSDAEIIISGFSGDYGRDAWKLNVGDRVEIGVWNPQSGAGPAIYETTVAADRQGPRLAFRQ